MYLRRCALLHRFHHYDLRLDNVMEHTPDPEQDAADPISKKMLGDASGRCAVLDTLGRRFGA